MKRFLTLATICSSIMFSNCQSNSSSNIIQNESYDSSTIILSIVYPDIEDGIHNDLIIFALVNNGEYIPIDDYDETIGQEIKERDSILTAVSSYYVCDDNRSKHIQIDSIVTSDYDCSETRVGRFGPSYNLNNIVLASNFQLPCLHSYKIIEPLSEDPLFNKLANDSMVLELIRKYESIDFSLIKMSTTSECLCIANAADSLTAISNLYFFEINGDFVKLTDFISEDVGTDSWGRGYEFLDFRDIDNDNIPELCLLFHGYEWTNLVIYKRAGNGYIKKLDTNIYGC